MIKVMYRKLMLLITILSLLFTTACGGGKKGLADPLNWEVMDFQYTNQDNKPFGLSDLKGKVWVADFIFTSCTTVCPPMTANMAKLQKQAKEAGLDVQFVSFSVDPEVDIPEKLKQYGEYFKADFSNWNFLTGYEQEEIALLADKSFKTVVEDDPNSNQVMHGTRFYLVDQNGRIVRSYYGNEDVPFDQIIQDIIALQ